MVHLGFDRRGYQDRVLDFAAGSGGDVIYLAGAGFAGKSFDSFMSNYVRGVNEFTVIDFDGFGSTYQIELYFVPKAALTSDISCSS